MERVLRQPVVPEIDDLFQKAFNLSGAVVYYPVRHHSPACSYHLLEVIRLYQPSAILIEGPADAGHLLPFIAEETSVPPLCIYYSYDDKEGLISEENEKYRAYYPFLAYSPEWVAIREAHRCGVPARMIDLPYAARLVNRGAPPQAQYSFNEDEEFEVNRYTAMLARKAGCRSFSEFWESRFELDAQAGSTVEFVRGVFALGCYMRMAEREDDTDYMENRARERYMADRIDEAARQYGRVLVVTGAFHVCGLLEPTINGPTENWKPHSEGNAAAYLMPYTFREADSKSGYSAGMPFPAYYQSVWEKLCAKKKSAFEAVALEFIIKTARYARATQPVSLPDEINAYAMARSLAALRGKPSPGVYELLDSVRSAFVKGDVNSTATFELDFLLRMLSGMGAGTVAAGGCIPPVVQEFRALCAKHRLKTGTVERQELTLDLVKNPAHYAKSRFLHQLLFLETGFCTLESGPDYVNGRDRNLVREHWVCRYGTKVETRLTDLSVYGTTLSQVCASLIERGFRDSITAAELGKLLLSVQVMGIEGFYGHYAQQITAVIENDRNFGSLCELLGRLGYLLNMQRMMEGEEELAVHRLMRLAFKAAAELLAQMRTVTEDEEQAACAHLRALYTLTVERGDCCDSELLAVQVRAALEDGFCNSRFYGACLAIRQKQGGFLQEDFCARITAYLESSLGQPEQAASFICGVFLIARDVLFADGAILERIDRIIASMDGEQFLAVLPNLRYAFTSFLPAELERLGEMAAKPYRMQGQKLTGSSSVTQAEAVLGMRLDLLAAEELRKWGLG